MCGLEIKIKEYIMITAKIKLMNDEIPIIKKINKEIQEDGT